MKIIKKISNIILFIILVTSLVNCNNKSKSNYNSDVMLKLFNVKTTNQLYVNIPDDNQKKCLIDKLVQINSTDYAKGTIVDDSTGEKITTLIDYNKIITINYDNSKEIIRFIAPFYVSGLGTGNFKYIGLFELNNKTNKVKHNDSKFIGDRIILEGVKYDGKKKVEVVIKTYGAEQSFSETPKETKKLNFNITDIITPSTGE